MLDRLVAVPDYVTLSGVLEPFAGLPIVGLADKFAGASINAGNAEDRRKLMHRLDDFAALTLVTPSAGFFRRLSELSDNCFFVDLTLRLALRGAAIDIITGMREDRLTPEVNKWLDSARGIGVTLIYIKPQAAEAKERELILAKDVYNVYKAGGREITASRNAIVTPYAWDEARDRGISIIKRR